MSRRARPVVADPGSTIEKPRKPKPLPRVVRERGSAVGHCPVDRVVSLQTRDRRAVAEATVEFLWTVLFPDRQ